MPREKDHAELLDAALRERAEQRLLWLRDPTRLQQLGDGFTRLFSPEGWESLEQALRERRYNDAELAQLPDTLADLARERARLAGRGWLGGFLYKPLAVGSTQRVPAAALAPLIEPVQTTASPSGPSEALRALGAALELDVMRFIELRERAEYDAETLRDKLARLLPKGKPSDALAPTADPVARWLPNAEPGDAPAQQLARLASSAEQREAFRRLPPAEQYEILAHMLLDTEQREALASNAKQREAFRQLSPAQQAEVLGHLLLDVEPRAGLAANSEQRQALARLLPGAEQRDALARVTASAGQRDALAQLTPSEQQSQAASQQLPDSVRRVLFAPGQTEQPPGAVSAAQLAETWLERTEDAWQELSRWLIKHSELPSTENNLARLFVGLRAFGLDGLARPDRRFFRLAAGARKLGFERDMTARMRGENAPALLLPQPVCVPVAAPRDVRVLSPDLEYGVLSDLSVAQGIGEGLALALISPAVGPLLSQPRGASVSAAMGGLFAQLRADSAYLRRVDGFERDAAEKAARIAAISLLLRARMNAALVLTWRASARSSEERVQQLAAAGQRAFGQAVPRGMLALTLLAQDSSEQQFLGLHWGFELHALLRERYDQDFYLNPRLAEVLRGAATRGAGLDAPGWAAELGAQSRGTAALDRLFELLG